MCECWNNNVESFFCFVFYKLNMLAYHEAPLIIIQIQQICLRLQIKKLIRVIHLQSLNFIKKIWVKKNTLLLCVYGGGFQ